MLFLMQSSADLAHMSCWKVQSIKALEDRFMVRITVEKGQRINRIRIQGPPNEVTSALDKIHNVFHEVTRQEHDKFVGGQVVMLVVSLTERSLASADNTIS